jgi:hypothetical protein
MSPQQRDTNKQVTHGPFRAVQSGERTQPDIFALNGWEVGAGMSAVVCRRRDVGGGMSAVGCRRWDVGGGMSAVGCRRWDDGKKKTVGLCVQQAVGHESKGRTGPEIRRF